MKTRIGVIGCGNISGAYFKGCRRFDFLEIVACADLIPSRAEEKAREFGVPKACPVEELLADPDIAIVVNLTTPQAHTEINLAAIQAGKHIYCEKPLAVNRQDGLKTLAAARERGVLVGCAPDTFLGGGLQTCRKLIDDGWIGEPVAATAFMTCHGHEHWHPAPEFYYQIGGGPMFDMGPYYLTALVNLLGPAKRVTGSARITFPERLITSQPKYGERIQVRTPTHITGVVDFASGAAATIIMSFDIWAARLPRIEVYGTQGSLAVPDPNGFEGPVQVFRAGENAWTDVPLTHRIDVSRGIGVADLALAATEGRPLRASGDLAYHVLDIMSAFEEASQTGAHVALESVCARPAPLPASVPVGPVAF